MIEHTQSSANLRKFYSWFQPSKLCWVNLLFSFHGPQAWNELQDIVNLECSFDMFKICFKHFLLYNVTALNKLNSWHYSF